MIQSFDRKDKITPEEAHRIGEELAKKLKEHPVFKDYEIILAAGEYTLSVVISKNLEIVGPNANLTVKEFAKEEALILAEEENESTEYAWYIDAVLSEAESLLSLSADEIMAGGFRIYTGFSPDIQHSANILFEDGGIMELGNMERASILFEDNKPVCAYFAASDGKDGHGFMNCTRTWIIPLRFMSEED